ncbi:hypothetical protein M514_14311 [Trichuris suis]|uniref:Uncharacterized protein n=1 Tax=Trichuris suis TaxID=68888 RepID=A0A085MPQ6_9BILA|nr:hypothetical protein M514_14311 [Trichuris suis]
MDAVPPLFFVTRTSDQPERTTKQWTTRQRIVIMSVVISYTMKTEERQGKEMGPERNGTGQSNVKIFKVDRCPSV